MHRQSRLSSRHAKNFWPLLSLLFAKSFFAPTSHNAEGLPQSGVFDSTRNPADCTNFACRTGSMCFLEESPCSRVPCQLTAKCVSNEDSQKWLNECKKLGCSSLNKCFLRNLQTCKQKPCEKVPDCLDDFKALRSKTSSLEICRGWVCPSNSKCYVEMDDSCKDCEPKRFCVPSQNYEEFDDAQASQIDLDKEPLIKDLENLRATNISTRIFDHEPVITQSDLEKEPVIEDLENLRPSYIPVPVKSEDDDDYMTTGQPVSAVKTKRLSEYPRGKYIVDSAYLKHIAGHRVVKLWMEKSKANNNQDYEDFLSWMSLVENILDSDLYKLWLEKVTMATTDVPEFQSWLSLRNLDVHRSPVSRRLTPKARSFIDARGGGAADITLPDSINLQAKNLFYSDKNFIFVDPSTHLNRHHTSFVDKQSAPPMVDQYQPRYENKNQAQTPQPMHQIQQPHQSRFDFNEPKPFIEPFPRNPTPPTAPYFKPVYPYPDQDYVMPDLRQAPLMRVPGGNIPTPMPIEYSAQTPDMNSYFLSNYTQIQNFSITASPRIDTQQHVRQPRFFFPSGQIDFGKSVQSNQWTQHWSNGLPSKRDSQAVQQESGASHAEEDPLSISVDTMVDKLSGLQQFKNLKPNLLKLDPRQPMSQMVLPSDNANPGQFPNLLIYFPPPLNFFMYYSAKNQLERKTVTSTEKPTTQSAQTTLTDISEDGVGFKLFDGDNSGSGKSEKLDKNKELEYIRKIIKELIDYWDEKEKSVERRTQKPCEEGPGTKQHEVFMPTTPQKPPSSTKAEVTTAPPTFNAFLDWLSKNSDKNFAFSDRDLQNKRPEILHNSDNNAKIDEVSLDDVGFRSFGEDTKKDPVMKTEKKIRILVDIDKNPELIKLLFAKNKINNSSFADSNEYQIIVNLDDFVKPNEEELISRRLIDIATNQLHKNVTDEKKIPKILWVFPIYDDDKDGTLINEFEKRSKEKPNAANRDGNSPKRSRHHGQSRTARNNTRGTSKPKTTQATTTQEIVYDEELEGSKEDEYDNDYDDQSYYDQQDKNSAEDDISREDS